MEHLILANAIADREAYSVAQATDQKEHLSDQGRALWLLIEEWYTRDPSATSINAALLTERAAQAHPRHADTFRRLISDLDGKACPGNFKEILLEGRRQSLREEMVIHLMEGQEESFRDILATYDGLEDAFVEDTDVYQGTDPASLYEAVVEGECIPLATDQLNENIRGGLLRGQHAMIFGRPEAAKSLFAINSLVSAAKAGFRAGFWENEDAIVTTQMRTAQCMAGVTEDSLRSPTANIRKRLERGGWFDRVIFKESPDGSLWEIRKWVETNQLDLVVINQLANLRAVEKDNHVLALATLARGARTMGKQTNCAVLSVHQAGDSAEGRRVLRMGDLDWSNTGIQATLDVLIGLGLDDALVRMNQRCLSLCKNKRSGRHDAFFVGVDLTRNLIV